MGNYILMAYTDNLPFSNAFLAEEHFRTAYKQERKSISWMLRMKLGWKIHNENQCEEFVKEGKRIRFCVLSEISYVD